MTISIRRTALTAAAIALLGLVAIGLVQAASSARGGAAQPVQPPPAAAPLGAAPLAAAPAPATADDAALAGELDAILAADQTPTGAATAVRDNALATGLRRLKLGRHLVHATVVLDLPQKGLTTIQVDHGTISTVGATSLTIAETGGTSPAVTLGSDTRVRRHGAKAAVADLKKGDEVVVMSKVDSSGATAYLVIVPKD